MGIAVNLVTYLTGIMHLSSATSANIVTDFMGTSFLLSLLGGFLADSYLGRYKTIAIFALVQTLGTIMLAISTKLPQLRPPLCQAESPPTLCKQATGYQMSILFASLYIMAIGTGGLKSSVSGFGTDQFDESDEKEKSKMNLFFGRFFFFVSLGTLMAVTVLVYIQDELSRSLGYGICSMFMFTAILIFLAGTRKYRYKKCAGSPVVHILQVLVAAFRKRGAQIPANEKLLYETTPEGSRIRHSDQFRCLDKAAVIMKEDPNTNNIISPNPWCISSVTKVEEVKMMIRLLPIWATTIIFWTTYAQMITFSVEQASTMERNVGSFKIPAGSLTVFFVLAILISLAVYDRLIIPVWKKWKGKPGFTSLQRIGIGLFLSAVGMAVAVLAEKRRLTMVKKFGRNTQTLPLSVFFLIPQFVLVGSGEAFIYTGQLDFFITQSPKGMKTISTGIFLTTLAFGFFLSSLLVTIVKKLTTYGGRNGWVGDSINYGRLDCFYGLLAILSFIDFGIYLVCAAWYRPHTAATKLQTEMVSNKGSSTEEKC
ncbi:protein NRT1/ PTR FAMILY 6.2-like [Olea europaea var. sylvestris]|nr:protein NRT1/ PTR FAMILY 6.2-like [Olea europaea var. sylvestris]